MGKTKRVNHSFEFMTSQEAWEGLNEWLFKKEKFLGKMGQGRMGNAIVAHDIFIRINKAWVDPDFNFHKLFGYTQSKWSSLISNYVDLNYLDLIKADISVREKKRQSMYNVGFRFHNTHDSGKDCLLSLTLSRRREFDVPVLVFHTRASEVTKRLLWDFLLVQRMGEHIYGNKPMALIMYAPMMYLNTEAFTMYNIHKPLKDILNKPEADYAPNQKAVMDLLAKYLVTDPLTLTYRVHRRPVNALRGLNPDRPLYAKQCSLYPKQIDYPDDCLTNTARKKYKAKLKREGEL